MSNKQQNGNRRGSTLNPLIDARRGSVGRRGSAAGSPFIKRRSSLRRSSKVPRLTTIRVHYSADCKDDMFVYGSSEGLSWSKGMRADRYEDDGENIYVLTLPVISLNSAIYFKPVLKNEFWAKGNDYMIKPGDSVDVYPFFFAEKGNVVKEMFTSQIMGDSRKIAVYLPPSYDENKAKKYPVMIMQDGHNLFDPEDSFAGNTWEMKTTMDELCHQGIQEQIIVGIYPVQRHYEYLPFNCDNEGGGAEKYLDFIQKELVPWVNKNLRVSNPKSVGISGSSYGGIICLYAWLTRPELFDLCGCFSPSCEWNGEALTEVVKANLNTREPEHKLYLDWGTVFDEGEAAGRMADHIEKSKLLSSGQFKKVIAEGHEHTEHHWAIRAPSAMTYLFNDPMRVQDEFYIRSA